MQLLVHYFSPASAKHFLKCLHKNHMAVSISNFCVFFFFVYPFIFLSSLLFPELPQLFSSVYSQEMLTAPLPFLNIEVFFHGFHHLNSHNLKVVFISGVQVLLVQSQDDYRKDRKKTQESKVRNLEGCRSMSYQPQMHFS